MELLLIMICIVWAILLIKLFVLEDTKKAIKQHVEDGDKKNLTHILNH